MAATAINDAMNRYVLPRVRGATIIDDLSSSVLAAQAAAPCLGASFNRVTKSSAATASFILKPILNGEAPPFVIVINDSPNSINVYPAVGETLGGAANTALAVAAGATGIFVRTDLSATLDWRAGTIA